MQRRALLVAGVGALGGCLGNGTDDTQGADGTDRDDSAKGSDHTDESNGTEQIDTSNGTTRDTASNGSAREGDGNGTDRDDTWGTRLYEVVETEPPESPIRREFEITRPDIHSPESPFALTVSISNRTDVTVTYGDTDDVLGLYSESDEFILVPPDEHEYAFDGGKRTWFATETINFTEIFGVGELYPDATRSQDLLLIRQPHKEFPETVPSEFAFLTSLGVEDEDAKYTVAFSLVSTQ